MRYNEPQLIDYTEMRTEENGKQKLSFDDSFINKIKNSPTTFTHIL